MKLLVSRCLLGVPCRYDGLAKTDLRPRLRELGFERDDLIDVCPENDGGLPTPRAPSEIYGGSAADVLAGKACILTEMGTDNTAAFLEGALIAERLCHKHSICIALLKSKSPSCGCNAVYDGTFSGTLTEGRGLTAEVLSRAGIRVLSERDLANFAALSGTDKEQA